jgi:hypothetical protein
MPDHAAPGSAPNPDASGTYEPALALPSPLDNGEVRVPHLTTGGSSHMEIVVQCEGCGHRWTSHAASGRTECRVCSRRLYIPAAVRRATSRTGASVPKLDAEKRGQSAHAKRAAPRDEPPSRVPTPRPTPTINTWATEAIQRILNTRAAKPAPTRPEPPAPSAATPIATPTPPTSAYLLVQTACRCPLLVAAPHPPREVRCPTHGRVTVERARRTGTPPAGARFASLMP